MPPLPTYQRVMFSTLIAGYLLVACTSAKTQEATPTATLEPTPILRLTDTPSTDVTITLERTACYGTCPIYKLTVRGDGTVSYEGEEFVAIKGQQTGSISQTQVEELTAAFAAADYFSLSDFYTSYDVTDAPSAITSITLNGQSKTIEHYYGDQHAPPALNELESKIDIIVNSAQWVGP